MKNTYLAVFGALALLTAATVGASYMHLDRSKAITLAMAIVAVKVSLITFFFMHLKFEGKIIRWLMITALFFVIFLLLMVLPDLGWSCPVCFGEAGSNLAKGFTWGILLLLTLPVILLGTIAYKISSSIRRKNESANTLSS